MIIDFAAIKQRYPMRAIIDALGLDGFDRGVEFIARNPTRDDESPGSFSINTKTGVWKDFATQDGGNDGISLWRYVKGMGSMGAAAAELEKALGGKAIAPPKPAINDVEYSIVMPADRSNRERPFLKAYGEPDHQYEYRGIKGYITLGFVCRWDRPEGKIIRPFFQFRAPTGAITWRFAGPSGDMPKPLYGLQRLDPRPRRVFIVEGEKAADAAQTIAPDGISILSWFGGVDQAKYADVSPLKGHDVTIIPDRDALKDAAAVLLPNSEQPGMKAARTIAAKLQAIGCRVSIVDYVPGESKHGWDLADAVAERWTSDDLQKLVQSRARVVPMPSMSVQKPEGFGKFALYHQLSATIFPAKKDTPEGKAVSLLDSWKNFEAMFNAYGVTCRLNEMAIDVEIKHVESDQNIMFEEVISFATHNTLKTSHINDHLAVIGNKNAYHPAVDWIKSKPWDGTSRIPEMFATIKVGNTDPELAFRLFFRWCISAVSLATQERMDINGAYPASQGVLVLVANQGVQKSRWILSLAPQDFIKPGLTLATGDKDSLITTTGTWIAEWAEVAGSKSASSVESLRSFVTRNQDTIRMPYGRKFVCRARRAVYIGTENRDDYLVDPEGNRRWWTIRVKDLDADHKVDTQQFWAEVYAAFKRGEQWWLTPEEMGQLNASNKSHEAVDPIAEIIDGVFDWREPGGSWVNTASILALAGRHNASTADCRRAAAFLRSMSCAERKCGHRPIEFQVPKLR